MTRTAPQPDRTGDVLASLPRTDRHVPKGSPMRRSRASRWRAVVLLLVHVAIGVHVWHWLAAGETVKPVEPSEAMETIELGRVTVGFVLFAALIGSTLVLGRWFCGWGCHVVALQDLSAWLLGRVGLRPKPVRSRLLVFAPWVVGGYMFVWPLLRHWFTSPEQRTPGHFPPPSEWTWQTTTSELWRTFPGPIMAIGTFVVVGFLVVWWLGAKGFCTYGCPYGAFFATADRVAPVRIVVDADRCEACGHCTSVCSSNVRVHEEVAKYGRVVDPGCMKCLDCVSVCPKDALSVGFAAPKPFVQSQQRIAARADFRWWEEVLLAVVAIWAAQFAFRGAWFGEEVPLLMAVGLGVCTAIFALLFVRLLVRPDVGFQHAQLKRGGRRTGLGTLALVGSAAWLVFALHTHIGQQLGRDAIAEARAPVRARFQDPARFDRGAAVDALDAVEGAVSWSLLAPPLLLEVRGLLFAVLDRDADAERQLREQFERRGSLQLSDSKLVLARLWALAGTRLAEAEALAEQVARDRAHPGAEILLRRIRQLRSR